jgi:hypothetical protein
METANLTGLIRILFWLIAIYYAIKFLARLFLPVLAKKVVEKASEQFQQQSQKQNTTKNTTTFKEEKPKPTKKVGEYVDFEEIE